MSNAPSLTESAAARVCAIAEKQGKPAILRLAVDGGGCSGFQYRFELADAPEGDDVTSKTGGATLVVDPVSLDLVAGSAVDFVESLGGAAFRVENPQAAAGCGCGSSFGI
ncbi:iron-sulfur cluster assembly accessory protein [Citromicrobium bathyomarinum]|jgi:iron-sulfur cluster assembly accessory protein|uniref:HesB/IscA family protein n=1 Tax=Sphingomonadales TaxID=204457 RepID=UPI000225E288|nr:iron-sulfur cluster assembly accessory protein [Citromicrobium sp. JLT1363]MBL4791607.1 iron-sulfur cluster assembly accessory protein [Citromicrobium sp.]MBO80812.1 iron-sulfur cluster assembly accessory protein [Citromicrobium sp.]|tara:strand:- start:314 stop:643 length:330 start_codon:yes stop_codon:yes gene_type:complete